MSTCAVYNVPFLVFWILQLSCACWCYNFDIQNSIKIDGQTPGGSFFGYSIASYSYGNVKSILIGAPNYGSPGSVPEGAVFECSQTEPVKFSCKEIRTKKSLMGKAWLGATVASRNGTTLVCAPHDSEYTGSCHQSQGNLNELEFIGPQEGENQISGTGFSAALSQDARKMYIGAPACDKDEGKMNFISSPPLGASVRFTNSISGDVALYSYAIATGKVLANGGEGVVVSIGFHQNSNYAGKVVILEQTNEETMKPVGTLLGYLSGEMFGAALAVSDLNGDGRDDIIIGAPHFTDYTQNNLKVETGRVYVYYKTANGFYGRGNPNELIVNGDMESGRFGHAVAALGDTNADGFNDLAIGAPYENSGSGSVYLYHGSATGLRNRPSQVIAGSQFTPQLYSFGFSFSSSGHDLDGNKHNDITVGAYQSDVVVHIPARPVVNLTAELEFDPSYLTMEKRDCTTQNPYESPTAVPCSTMKYCLSYTGLGVPQDLQFNISIMLDAKQTRNYRLFFLTTNDYKKFQSVQLRAKERQCWQEKVYVKPNIRDKLSPMTVTMASKLLSADKPPALVPILNALGANGSTSRDLSIFRECGDDKVCTPDLQLKIKTNMNTHYQGSPERLVVNVDVFNAGEDGFGSEFFLQMPSTMKFESVDKESTDQIIFCYPPDEGRQQVLRCDIGNPLNAQQTVHLTVIFQLQPGDLDRNITFSAEVNSTIPELLSTLTDNSQSVTIRVQAKANLKLAAYSRPESLSVNMSAVYQNEQSALPSYAQFFEIQNLGPSDVLGSQFQLSLQSKTKQGQAIMKLISKPNVTEGNAVCQQAPDADSSDNRFIVINCTAKRFSQSQKIKLHINAQLAAEAITKFGNTTDSFTLVSTMTANITSMLYDQDASSIPQERIQLDLLIEKHKNDVNVLQATPVWIPIVSAVGAIIVLAGISFVLHRCGFFKRDKSYQQTGQVVPQPEEGMDD